MPRCINCWIAIPITQQYRYNATHMDVEVISVLEEWIARQVIDEDYLCQECVSLLILESNNRNEGNIGERQLGHVSVCVCCGISIGKRTGRRSRALNYGDAEWIYSANIISPLEMPSNARACNACWLRAHRQPRPPAESGSGLFVINTVSMDNEDISQDPNPFISGSSSVVKPPSSASTDIENVLREPVSVAESCGDAGDSGSVEEPRDDGTDIFCDDDDDDSDTLVESNVCRVCLALDVKMYNLKDIELREMFQNITGIVVTENNHSMLERLCWECAGRLKAAAAFRNKALLSDALLQGLANTGEQIRKNDVTLIKENQDYLKSAGTLSIVEVFHTVEIDAEYESVPSILENNDTDIVQNTVRKDSIELNESIEQENSDQIDVEDESMIEVPIKTEIEYDPICPNTSEEYINIGLETNPLFRNNIPLREDTINSAYSCPPPGCSHVEPKYPIIGYLLKTPSDCENKIKKTIVKITNRESTSKIVSNKSKEVIIHDHALKGDVKLKHINLKVGGISKKTSNQKLVKTQVRRNTSVTSTDEEYLSLENFEF